MDNLATVRSIIRKDLESVGMIPTGIAVQMIAKDDPLAGVGLLIEAIYSTTRRNIRTSRRNFGA